MYNDEGKYGVKAELPSAAAWTIIGTWLIKTEAKDAEDVDEYKGFRLMLYIK